MASACRSLEERNTARADYVWQGQPSYLKGDGPLVDLTEHDHEIWLWMPRGYRAWSWRSAFSGWKSWPQIPQVIG